MFTHIVHGKLDDWRSLNPNSCVLTFWKSVLMEGVSFFASVASNLGRLHSIRVVFNGTDLDFTLPFVLFQLLKSTFVPIIILSVSVVEWLPWPRRGRVRFLGPDIYFMAYIHFGPEFQCNLWLSSWHPRYRVSVVAGLWVCGLFLIGIYYDNNKYTMTIYYYFDISL